MKTKIIIVVSVILIIIAVLFKMFFSEEAQNKLNRKLTSTFGTKNGCLELYQNGNVTFRMFKVEKLSTAYGTDDDQPRPYRYGYGYRDINLNNKLDENEKSIGKKYFEIPDFSQYIYFDNSTN